MDVEEQFPTSRPSLFESSLINGLEREGRAYLFRDAATMAKSLQTLGEQLLRDIKREDTLIAVRLQIPSLSLTEARKATLTKKEVLSSQAHIRKEMNPPVKAVVSLLTEAINQNGDRFGLKLPIPRKMTLRYDPKPSETWIVLQYSPQTSSTTSKAVEETQPKPTPEATTAISSSKKTSPEEAIRSVIWSLIRMHELQKQRVNLSPELERVFKSILFGSKKIRTVDLLEGVQYEFALNRKAQMIGNNLLTAIHGQSALRTRS